MYYVTASVKLVGPERGPNYSIFAYYNEDNIHKNVQVIILDSMVFAYLGAIGILSCWVATQLNLIQCLQYIISENVDNNINARMLNVKASSSNIKYSLHNVFIIILYLILFNRVMMKSQHYTRPHKQKNVCFHSQNVNNSVSQFLWMKIFSSSSRFLSHFSLYRATDLRWRRSRFMNR